MNLVELECPNCHGKLKAYSDYKYVICNFCDTQFLLDDGVNRTEFIQHTIDEAKIKEAEIKKEIELEKIRNEASQNRQDHISGITMIIAFVLVTLFLALTEIF